MDYETLKPVVAAAVTALVATGGFLAFLPQRLADAFFSDLLARRLEKMKAENASSLEKIKAEHAATLEAAKHELQWLADRGARSNEREFQAIADAWEAFLDADIITKAAVISYTRHADLSRMSEAELIAYVDEVEMHRTYREAILKAAAGERNGIFGRHLQGERLAEAQAAIHKAQALARRHSVFMPVALFELFEECIALVRRAYSERSTAAEQERRGGLPHQAQVDLISELGDANLARLRVAVRERLLRGENSRLSASITIGHSALPPPSPMPPAPPFAPPGTAPAGRSPRPR